jgi:hypothetical protein
MTRLPTAMGTRPALPALPMSARCTRKTPTVQG